MDLVERTFINIITYWSSNIYIKMRKQPYWFKCLNGHEVRSCMYEKWKVLKIRFVSLK
jgi:hypothetical protein